MTRVLITGSTANQSNPITHERSSNFTGMITDTLRSSGVEVTWQDPSVFTERAQLQQFDKVLVGISSPLALGSNRIYGALSLIDQMWGDSRLNLVLDAPDPNRITRGLYSVARNPESLTKEFFSYRKNYGDLSDPRFKEGVLSACDKLLNEEWPSYFFPVFPWMTAAQVETQLPQGATGKSVLTNLDQILLDKFEQEDDGVPREHRWMAERGLYRPWLKSQSLTDPVVLLRSDHRTNLHPYFSSRLASAQGLLHSPARSKGIAWWTPRVAMALAQHTPVFTAWRESQFLGPSWAVFPRTFEVLSEKERVDVATEQYNTYVPAINDVATCAANLLDSLELEKTA